MILKFSEKRRKTEQINISLNLEEIKYTPSYVHSNGSNTSKLIQENHEMFYRDEGAFPGAP